MRIVAFEVREDEKPVFALQAERPGVELELVEEPLSLQNIELCRGADAVLTLARSYCDAELAQALVSMGVRTFVTRTVGLNHIDVEAAREAGLFVSNVSYAPDSVADFTVMLMLVALRKYKPAVYRQNVNDYSLTGLMGRTLSSLTVGVVGAGAIGRAVMARLQGFGCKIVTFDLREPAGLLEGVRVVGLDELFSTADVVSLHVPLTPQTRHMVDDAALARMKDGVVLVNTARGDLMDTDALTRGMESGKIGALAMDVFANEDGIYHRDRTNDIIANRDMAYLRQFPNSVFTQHLAFYTEQSVEQMVVGAVDIALAR